MDFAAWKSNSTRDVHSIAGLVGTGPFTVENIFVSSSDVHLNSLAKYNPALNAAGSPGLAVDFDGQIRPAGGAADIGADEAGAVTAATRTLSGRVTSASGRGISYARVMVRGGGMTQPVALLTARSVISASKACGPMRFIWLLSMRNGICSPIRIRS